MKSKAAVKRIIETLKELYPDGLCSLQYEKDYELLFAVRLSAQCTDERVNNRIPYACNKCDDCSFLRLKVYNTRQKEGEIKADNISRAGGRDVGAAVIYHRYNIFFECK